jgi:hypothetical protein
MGLSIMVGILSDLDESDEEGTNWVLDELHDVNRVLAEKLFLEHTEPKKCDVWGADGYGYSGLHALREVAGFLWQGKQIPKDRTLTGDDTTQSDPLSNKGFNLIIDGVRPTLFQRLVGKKPNVKPLPFLHLLCHSDSAGYYVPIDFPTPLAPDVTREETVEIWPLGSVQQLQREVCTLINALEIPNNLDSQSDALWEAMDNPDPAQDQPMWLAQPIAAYSALILKEACEKSLATGAAISFG